MRSYGRRDAQIALVWASRRKYEKQVPELKMHWRRDGQRHMPSASRRQYPDSNGFLRVLDHSLPFLNHFKTLRHEFDAKHDKEHGNDNKMG